MLKHQRTQNRTKTRVWCRRKLSLAIVATIGAAAASVPLYAQDLEEIVVTAERREQNLQDVPISATVLNSDAMAQMGVKTVMDLQQVSPSLAINTYNRSTFINIRGVGLAQSTPTSVPGVAFYLDGTFIPHEFTIASSFYDIASIEVLRGPQGTLTGQNSTGGAVYVRSTAPEFGQWSGSVNQTLGNYDWTRTEGAVNIPMGDKVAMRVAGVVEKRDSFTRNIGPSPSQPGNVDFRGFRVAMAIQPTDSFSINLRHEDYLTDTDFNAIKNYDDVVTSDPFTIEEDAISLFNQDGYRSSAEFIYDFSNVRVRWLTSYQYGTYEDLTDGDRTATAPPSPAGPGRVSYGLTQIDSINHELNILSNDDGPLEWIVGAFYFDETNTVDVIRYTLGTVTPVLPATRTILVEGQTNSKSIFGQVGYQFNSDWKLDVGLRRSEDELAYDRARGSVPADVGIQDSSEVTGRIALNWTPSDDLMLYSSLSKGYKAGGVNLFATDPNFDPETNVVLEIGAKSTLMEGHLRLNGDVFFTKYNDIQVLGRNPGGFPLQENAGKAKSRGIELEALGVWGGVQINAGLSYLDAEFTERATLSNPLLVTLPPPLRFQDVMPGDDMPFSPKITANLGIQYNIELGDGGVLTPRLQGSYLDEQLSTPFPNVRTIVPSRTLFDARLTYESNSFWRLEGFVTNLSDKTYIASHVQNSSSSLGGIIYGAPRQYGVKATFSFD